MSSPIKFRAPPVPSRNQSRRAYVPDQETYTRQKEEAVHATKEFNRIVKELQTRYPLSASELAPIPGTTLRFNLVAVEKLSFSLIQEWFDRFREFEERPLEPPYQNEYNQLFKKFTNIYFVKMIEAVLEKYASPGERSIFERPVVSPLDYIGQFAMVKTDIAELASFNRDTLTDVTKSIYLDATKKLTARIAKISTDLPKDDREQDKKLMQHLIAHDLPRRECLKQYELLQRRRFAAIDLGILGYTGVDPIDDFAFFGGRCALVEEDMFATQKQKRAEEMLRGDYSLSAPSIK